MLYDMLITDHIDEDRTILSDTTSCLSYSEIDDLCAKLQIFFERYGLNSKDRILIYAERKLTTAIII